MTNQQKIMLGGLGLIVIVLIGLGVSRKDNGVEDKFVSSATSTEEIKTDTTLTSERILLGAAGASFASPVAGPNDSIVFAENEVTEKVGERTDVLKVVYQSPGAENTYTYLVLFRGGDQQSRLFLGENVKVSSITTSKTASANADYYVNAAFDNNKSLSVAVVGGVFDFDSATIGN